MKSNDLHWCLGTINDVELPSVSSFRSFDKDHTRSMSNWQHEKNDCARNELEKVVAQRSSVDDEEDLVEGQLNIGINMSHGTQSSIVVDNIFDTIGSSMNLSDDFNTN